MAKPSIKMLLNMVMIVELRLFCIEVNFCRGGWVWLLTPVEVHNGVCGDVQQTCLKLI